MSSRNAQQALLPVGSYLRAAMKQISLWLDIAHRVDRRLRKLIGITRHARATDVDAWKTLLCRYYQLSTRIKQQCLMDDVTASQHAKLAVSLAIDLQNSELIASAFVNSACTNTQQGKLDEARQDIASAMERIDRIRNSHLKGQALSLEISFGHVWPFL